MSLLSYNFRDIRSQNPYPNLQAHQAYRQHNHHYRYNVRAYHSEAHDKCFQDANRLHHNAQTQQIILDRSVRRKRRPPRSAYVLQTDRASFRRL